MDCILYARVSTKEQEREGFSIPAQLDLMRKYAQREKMQILGEYIDSQTAKCTGRDSFASMLKFIKKQKKPVALLVEKTDRLTRNFHDELTIDDLIKNHGTEVHYIKESEVLSLNSSSHQKFIHGIKVLMAKNYIDNLSEEVKKGLTQSLKEGGWPFPPPYGYKKVNKELVPCEFESKYVIRAYDIYSKGMYPFSNTINRLYDEGTFFKTTQPKASKGTLHKILTNPVYIGRLEAKGVIYAGRHEPIVPLNIWEEVQRVMSRNSKGEMKRKHDFIFKGLLYCAKCGSAFTGEHKKDGKYTYYRCNGKTSGKCDERYISETALLQVTDRILKSIIVPAEMRETLEKTIKEQEALLDESEGRLRRELEAARNRLRGHKKQAYQDRLSGKIDEAFWTELAQEFEAQENLLEERSRTITRAEDNYYELGLLLLELGESLDREWFSGNASRKREILNFVYSNFSVRDGKVSVELKEPFCYMAKSEGCREWWASVDRVRTLLSLHSDTIRRAVNVLAA